MKTQFLKSTIVLGLILFHLNVFSQHEVQLTENERMAQVTLVPGFGTSHGMKDSVTNNLSFNVLVGFEHSLQGLELGGIYNYDRQFVNGVQLAGMGNSIGGDLHGGQFSGLINTVEGSSQGAQMSGGLNLTKGEFNGLQWAGFVNLSLRSVTGGQAAGFANFSKEQITGIQFAGFANAADSVLGVQGAGFGNLSTGNIKGAQLAGFMNKAKDVQGVQAAGFINVAKNVKGTQIALINIADSLTKGVPIGLFNFIKSGIIQPSIRYNEVFDGNLYFASGSERLYTIFLAGFQFGDSTSLWSYGAGLGTQFRVKNRWKLNLELTSQQISTKNEHENDVNLLNRLSLDFGFDVAKHFSVTAGPVINFYVTQVPNTETGELGSDIALNTFYDHIDERTRVQAWVGYNVAIRF